jgi:hypothetical protein
MNAIQSLDSSYKGQTARYELSRALSPVMITSRGVQGNIPRSIPIARQIAWIKQGFD